MSILSLVSIVHTLSKVYRAASCYEYNEQALALTLKFWSSISVVVRKHMPQGPPGM